jgi:hypothetical protein
MLIFLTYKIFLLNFLGIEGFYLLRNLPDASITRTIKPMELPENLYQNIQACLTSVNSTFVDDPMVRKEWNDWAHLHCPQSNSAIEYLEHLRTKRLPYHNPLKAVLLPRSTRINFPVWKDRSMNMNPVESRLYLPRDQQLIMDINSFTGNQTCPDRGPKTCPGLVITYSNYRFTRSEKKKSKTKLGKLRELKQE